MPRYLSICLTLPDAAAAPGQHAQEQKIFEQNRLKILAAEALWCQRYTPLAARDAPDGVMLDVAGAAHLFDGERALMERVEEDFRQRKILARTAIADTPETAWALARFGEDKARLLPAGLEERLVARAIANLPMAALRLEAETVYALSQTGLKRIGDIILRPRAPLTARFGKALFARLDAMLGRSKSAISPQFVPPAYIAERRFADGIVALEVIEATIQALAQDLSGLLERHKEGARKLTAALFRTDGKVMHVDCSTSRPQRDTLTIARLFHEKIDAAAEQASNNADPFDAGYGFDIIRLAVMVAEPLSDQQGKLRVAPANAHPGDDKPVEELPHFLDRMSARLGAQRVLRFSCNDTHIPEHAIIAGPAIDYAAQQSAAPALPLQEMPQEKPFGIARPIRLFEKAEPVEAVAMVPDGPPLRFRWRRALHEVVAYEGPERIAPQWWKQEAEALTRDYFRVEDRGGQRFWLYREGLYAREAQRPRWFLQGLFG